MKKNHVVENKIGLKLKKYRKEKGMTQGEVAEILKISDAYVSKIERGEGEPTFHLMEKIMEFISGRGTSESSRAVAEERTEYGEGYISAVAAMMREMDADTQKDIFLSVQKEKLLRELLKERLGKKVG